MEVTAPLGRISGQMLHRIKRGAKCSFVHIFLLPYLVQHFLSQTLYL